MTKLMNEPDAFQIDSRFQDLNNCYSRDVIMWVLTASYKQLLCDSERDAHRHAHNLKESFTQIEFIESCERLYPELIEFWDTLHAKKVV